MANNKKLKKASTKNQHYVPQFYQKYFSTDSKNIGVFALLQEKYISHAPIKSQGSGDYIYSSNDNIEKCLSTIEGTAKDELDKIIKNPKKQLSLDQQAFLCLYLILQFGRTPKHGIELEQILHEAEKLLLKEQPKQNIFSVSSDSKNKIVNSFSKSSFGIAPPALTSLVTCINIFKMGYLNHLQCKVLINKTKIPFITSDTPATLYNQHRERLEYPHYAINKIGTEIYFPITPLLSIILYDYNCYKFKKEKQSFVEIDNEDDVNELNKLVVFGALYVLFFNSNITKEAELRNLLAIRKKYYPEIRNQIKLVNSDTENPAFYAQKPSPYCNLILSFITERHKYKIIKNQGSVTPEC